MWRPKKLAPESFQEDEVQGVLLLNVMDRETKKRVRIDANKETDWKTKYLHVSGKEF